MIKLVLSLCLILLVVLAGGGRLAEKEAMALRPVLAAERPSQDDLTFLYARALAAYYLSEYVRAESLFRCLVNQAPDAVRDDILYRQAECALRRGHLAQARAVYRQCLQQAPQGPRAKLAEGRLALLGR